MSIRSKIAVLAGKTSKYGLNLLGRKATSLPGKIALKIDPNVLNTLAKDTRVIFISGTNGKTLTTSMIYTLLKEKYPVFTNESGSNMIQGITSTFLSTKVKDKNRIAILEVDEAYIKQLTPRMKVDYIVFTNVFRDQMDRFGETYTTYKLMTEGLVNSPDTKIISNGDLPIFNMDSLRNTKIFYGFNHENNPEDIEPYHNSDGLLCPSCKSKLLKYKLNTYANLGNYYCDCGFSRPQLKYSVNEITDLTIKSSSFKINNTAINLDIAGIYNIYNALAAFSIASELGLTENEIQNGFSKLEKRFGRQESFNYKGKEIILNLVKNPVGFDQIVDLLALDKDEKTLIGLLNDNYADGRDVSWIWDGNFEKLAQDNFIKAYVGGIRQKDLYDRLEVAGFKNLDKVNSNEEVLKAIENSDTDRVYILLTYTALLDLRSFLEEKRIING